MEITTQAHAPEAAGPRPVFVRLKLGGLLREWIRDSGGLAVGALILLALAFLTWQIGAFRGGGWVRTLISDLAFLPVSITAGVLAIRASRHEALDHRTQLAWRIIGVSFFFYWLGDVVWTLEENLGEAPFPSLADAFYLAFYPTCMWGILTFPTAPRSSNDKLKLWLDTLTVVIASFMMLFYWVIGPTLRDQEAGVLTGIVSIGYPLGDLVLIFAITRILLGQPPRGTGHALGILAPALGLFVVADIAFAHLELNGMYQGGDWPDSLWMIAQVTMALSAQYQYWHATSAQYEGFEHRRRARTFSPFPYLVIFASFALLAVVGWEEKPYPLGGLLLGALAVTALVVTRQIASLKENTRLVDELHILATTDALTGLLGRRHFFDLAEREYALAARYSRPLSAMMIDVDHFKRINDTYGHAVGDTLLRTIARRLHDTLRSGDIVGRYGGDEMVVLLPETNLESGLETATRLLSSIEGEAIPTEAGPVPVSISVGVASSSGSHDLGGLLMLADQALFEAKQAGRRTTRAAALSAGA